MAQLLYLKQHLPYGLLWLLVTPLWVLFPLCCLVSSDWPLSTNPQRDCLWPQLTLGLLADSQSKEIQPDSGQNPGSRFSVCKCFIFFPLLRLDVCVACVILKLSSNPQRGRRPIPSPR